jgi:membrane-associated HD superfamily phosphohydrolase
MEDWQIQKHGAAFKALQIIHGALCTGITLFILLSFFKAQNKHADIQPGDSPLLYIAIAIALALVFFSHFIFYKHLVQIDFSTPLKDRLMQYQTACIKRFALLEGAAIINVVSFLLSGSYISLIIAVTILLHMVAKRPTKPNVIAALQINYPETLDQ